MARERKANERKKGDWVESEGRLASPFAALAARRTTADEGPKDPVAVPERSTGTPEPKASTPSPPRAVLRLERKGRGGRTVTRVEKLGLSPSEARVWCEELRSQLGCGGSLEGSDLVFQGDQVERLTTLLPARGVRKVVGP